MDYACLAITKIVVIYYHPNGNRVAERVNHTMTEMLPMVVNKHVNGWDVQLPHVKSASNMSAATGLPPNEIPMGRLPQLLITVFERPNVRGDHSMNRDQLAYRNLARGRQQRAYDFLHHQHALTVTQIERRNSVLVIGLGKTPTYAVRQSV